MDSITNALKIIKEQLPKFLDEMEVPFLGKDKPRSVMDTSVNEKAVLEQLLTLGASAVPVAKGLQLASKVPGAIGIGTAVATQDPTAVLNPLASLATYSSDAEAAISMKPGSNPVLNLIHNMTGGNFVKLLSERGSLSSPSIAISENVYPFQRTPTLVFNPSSHLYDPATAKANQLFNRDAYVDRGKGVAELAQQYRLGGEDLRLTEGASPGLLSQLAAIKQSPRFSSFAEYERSMAGAPTLGTLDEIKISSDYWVDDFDKWYKEKGIADKYPKASKNTDFYSALKKEADAGDVTAKSLLRAAKYMPSDYAELKVIGEVPVNSDTVSALVLPQTMYDSWWRDDIRKYLDKLGIRVGTPNELMPSSRADYWSEKTDELVKVVKDAASVDKSVAKEYENLPEPLRNLITFPSFLHASAQPKQAKRIVADSIMESYNFAADVASTLTKQDADEVLNLLINK